MPLSFVLFRTNQLCFCPIAPLSSCDESPCVIRSCTERDTHTEEEERERERERERHTHTHTHTHLVTVASLNRLPISFQLVAHILLDDAFGLMICPQRRSHQEGGSQFSCVDCREAAACGSRMMTSLMLCFRERSQRLMCGRGSSSK
jgi:hypothetical protein